MSFSKILTDRRLWLLLAAGLAFALLRWTGAMDLLSLDMLKTIGKRWSPGCRTASSSPALPI